MTTDDLKALAKYLQDLARTEPTSIPMPGMLGNVQVTGGPPDPRGGFARTLEAVRYRPFMMRGAAIEYIMRKHNGRYPCGSRDKQGRWYPDAVERASCCDCIREPSVAYPYSLFKHCMTLPHICTKLGVDLKGAKQMLKFNKLPLLMGQNERVDSYLKERFSKGV